MENDDCEYGDNMVVLAALVSRVEALVVASMLEAGGIQVHVGANHHAALQVISLALGGHRLWIPASQHEAASQLLVEVLGEDEWSFSFGLQRAVKRVLGVWAALIGLQSLVAIWIGAAGPASLLFFPLNVASLPVNPQGRGDYNLHASVYD